MYVGFLFNFSQGKGDCLEDEPARNNDYAYPDLPPGAMYNAEHQCRLQFGVREASVCSQLHEVNGRIVDESSRTQRVCNDLCFQICSKLWCIVDGICTTMLHPAAPGTHCGKHMVRGGFFLSFESNFIQNYLLIISLF